MSLRSRTCLTATFPPGTLLSPGAFVALLETCGCTFCLVNLAEIDRQREEARARGRAAGIRLDEESTRDVFAMNRPRAPAVDQKLAAWMRGSSSPQGDVGARPNCSQSGPNLPGMLAADPAQTMVTPTDSSPPPAPRIDPKLAQKREP